MTYILGHLMSLTQVMDFKLYTLQSSTCPLRFFLTALIFSELRRGIPPPFLSPTRPKKAVNRVKKFLDGDEWGGGGSCLTFEQLRRSRPLCVLHCVLSLFSNLLNQNAESRKIFTLIDLEIIISCNHYIHKSRLLEFKHVNPKFFEISSHMK